MSDCGELWSVPIIADGACDPVVGALSVVLSCFDARLWVSPGTSRPAPKANPDSRAIANAANNVLLMAIFLSRMVIARSQRQRSRAGRPGPETLGILPVQSRLGSTACTHLRQTTPASRAGGFPPLRHSSPCSTITPQSIRRRGLELNFGCSTTAPCFGFRRCIMRMVAHP